MFRQTRGYGNLNDLQAQLTPNFGYAGRLRDLTEQLQPKDVINAIGMKKGGRVKKYKVKQSNKNIAIAKNVVKVYYDRPKRRAAKRKPRQPVEEKKVIVQPSQVRPQFVTNVMGGNPGQPIALNEFTKRLGVLEDQLNKPKVLNKIVEEEKKVEIPQFVDTIPDAELQAIEQQIEESKDEVAAVAAPYAEEIVEPGNLVKRVLVGTSKPKDYLDTGYDYVSPLGIKHSLYTNLDKTSIFYKTKKEDAKSEYAYVTTLKPTEETLQNIKTTLLNEGLYVEKDTPVGKKKKEKKKDVEV